MESNKKFTDGNLFYFMVNLAIHVVISSRIKMLIYKVLSEIKLHRSNLLNRFLSHSLFNFIFLRDLYNKLTIELFVK